MKYNFITILLGAAFLVAALMRFAALSYALPLDVMGDEFVHVATAFSFLNEQTLFASQAFSYVPSLMAAILAPFFALFGGVGMLLGWFSGIEGFKEFAILNSTLFMAGARALSALFGIAFLWILFLVVKHVSNKKTALVAALLAAFDFWLVHESQAGHLWMPVTTLIVFAWYALIRLSETGELRWYIFSAITIAAGYWAGYIPVLLLLWLLVAHFFAPERKLSNLLYGAGFSLLLLGIISWFNPISFARKFGSAFRTLGDFVGLDIFPDFAHLIPDPTSAHEFGNLVYFIQILFFDNPLVLILGILGLILFLARKRFSFPSLLIVGFPLVYIVVASFVWVGADARYMLPILPSLLFGTAYIVMSACEAERVKALRILGGTALVFSLCVGIALSVSYTKLFWNTDTRILARAWIVAEIPPGSSILVHSRYFELPRNQEVTTYLNKNLSDDLRTRDRYLLEHPDLFDARSFFVLKAEEAEAVSYDKEFSYIVRTFYCPEAFPCAEDPERPEEAALIPVGYERIKSFYPQDSMIALNELLQDPDNPAPSLLKVKNLGPYVEIFKRN